MIDMNARKQLLLDELLLLLERGEINLKKEFICVFNPYVKPGKKRKFRYRVVSINRLNLYIPDNRVMFYVKKMFVNGWQKQTFSVQGKGKLYMYRK